MYGRVAGQAQALTVAVDPGNDQLISLAAIDEHAVAQVVEWLKPWVEELEIEVLVSIDLVEAAHRLYQEQSDAPRTNNRTEQAIGRWRTRSRSVRGFKRAAGLQSAFWVCANGNL